MGLHFREFHRVKSNFEVLRNKTFHILLKTVYLPLTKMVTCKIRLHFDTFWYIGWRQVSL